MSDTKKAVLYCRLANKVKPKAAIYCRSALADDCAIKAQEKVLYNFAAGQMLVVGGTYCDNGESGVTLDRPAFKRMMSAIDDSDINCIIVKDIARVSRNPIQFVEWLTEILEKNVRVIAVNDGFDSNDTDSDLHKSLAVVLNKAYREELAASK
ncbi:hypothetical protein FACS18949_06040 [Clostridia bacterium]|nr:hypothetical protein FACS18949_06040 [Clostridia bacterium]